ncbi:hypothetical protein J7L70_09180 [Candidatus Bathyarchaeota archaeon]|nr:hypothetical protein [Candidatus Bathyarchaeota archaeon]
MEVDLPYPFTRVEFIIRVASAVLGTVIFIILAFTSQELRPLFALTFTGTFPIATLTHFLLFRTVKFRRALKVLRDKGVYSWVERRKGWKATLVIFAIIFSPFFALFILPPALVLGLLLSVIVSVGVSDSVFYMYVRKAEEELNCRIVKFYAPIPGETSKYIRGIKILERD